MALPPQEFSYQLYIEKRTIRQEVFITIPSTIPSNIRKPSIKCKALIGLELLIFNFSERQGSTIFPFLNLKDCKRLF